MAVGDKLVTLDGLKAVYQDVNGNVNDLKSAMPGIFNTESFDGGVDGNKYQIEKGYYDISTGELKNGAAYAYSAVQSKFGGRTVYVSVGEDYNFAVRMWDGNGDFDSSKNTGYIKNALVYVPDGYTIAFNFRNNDTTSMNSSDYNAISNSFHLYTDGNQYDDTTLSTIKADAKERIYNLIEELSKLENVGANI